jgi:hypothetical protein
MTKSKSQQERQWRQRKDEQHPHGKVKSFEELGTGVEGKNNDNK